MAHAQHSLCRTDRCSITLVHSARFSALQGCCATLLEINAHVAFQDRGKVTSTSAFIRWRVMQECRSYTLKKPNVRTCSPPNSSRVGDGCPNFMGAWSLGSFCRKTSMPIKFLVLREGGIYGGRKCQFYSNGPGTFRYTIECRATLGHSRECPSPLVQPL